MNDETIANSEKGKMIYMILRNILRELGVTTRTEIQEDIYSFPEGEHVIFYTIGPAEIEIIGNLQQRMDTASNLH